VAEFRLAVVSWALSMAGLSTLFAVGLGTHFARTFAGPIHALRRDLDVIASTGEPRPVQLRDGDQLVELADSINEAIAAVARSPEAPAADRAGPPTADALDARDAMDALRRDMTSQIARLDPASLPSEARERVEAWLCGLRDLLEK
jgi:hypothetical protein